MRNLLVASAVLVVASSAPGYIHLPPKTLKGVCEEASWIRVLTVKAVNKEKGHVTLEIDGTLQDNPKWKSGVGSYRMVVPTDAPGAKSVLDQLSEGARVVLFSNEGEGEKPFAFGYACLGKAWYSTHYSPGGKCWSLLRGEPGLSSCYHGDVKDLPGYVKSILDGKDVKVPTMAPKEKVDHRERAKQIDDAMKKDRGEK